MIGRSPREAPGRRPTIRGGPSGSTTSRSRSPLTFFVLVFALSVPFWLVGAATGLELLPGLPASALMAVCPAVAASLLAYRDRGAVGVVELLKRAGDYDRIRPKVWYAPLVLLMPALAILAYGVMRLLRWPLPIPHVPLSAAPVLFLAFLVFGLGEELGWSGYAIDPMQARRGALGAAVLLGLGEATWHLVALVQAGRSPAWIAWWLLGSVAGRVLTVWLYDNTGRSVFAAALFHATRNLSWQLFPNHGSHWDPRIAGLITALAAAIVAAVWGPRTLSVPASRALRVARGAMGVSSRGERLRATESGHASE